MPKIYLRFQRYLFLILLLSLSWHGLAAPSLPSLSLNVDENTENGTVIGRLSASGAYTDSLKLEVGTQELNNWDSRGDDFVTINFNTAFPSPPIIFSQVQSNGNYTVTYTANISDYEGPLNINGYDILFRTRQQNASSSGFETILETDLDTNSVSSVVESFDFVGGSETVGWLAMEKAAEGIWSDLPFEVLLTDTVITDAKTTINFSGPFYDTPQVLGAVATNNGEQQVGVGIDNPNTNSISLYAREFEGKSHTSAEAISLLLLQGTGILENTQGQEIGEVGSVTFSDTDRSSASTVTLSRQYNNPVVFIQPLNEDIEDTVFRFTNISNNSFSGYLHYDDERSSATYWSGNFELPYFVFEAGSWEISIQNYNYSITSGNDSGAFAIDADTGEISIADSNQLDYESGITQYTLGVQVTDGNGETSNATVTISVNDVSDSLNTGSAVINGLASQDQTGWQLARAGDVNGDGLQDIIIGVPGDDSNGTDTGRAYVIFGNSEGSLPSLSEVAAGNGGFVINGENSGDQAGFAVTGGDDVNGDGLDDVLIGAPYADPNGENSGKTYVVFGKTDTAAVNLSDIEQSVYMGNMSGQFNGVDDYIEISGYTGITGTNSRTVEAWIKTTADDAAIASWGSYTDYGKKWVFRVQSYNGTPGTIRVENYGGYIVGSTIVNDGQWHHVACTFENDGSPDVTDVKLYVDGVLEESSNSKANELTTESDNPVTIGNDDANRYFNGEMKEFRIWEVARSQSELQAEMNQVLTGTETGLKVYYPFDDHDLDIKGFVINGSYTDNTNGGSLVMGDVNADGLADLIIGEAWEDAWNSTSLESYERPNRAYIVYGKNDNISITLADIVADTNNRGFAVRGSYTKDKGHYLGNTVLPAGDTNSDGLTDFLLDAIGSSKLFTILGKTGGDAIDYDNFSSDNGIVITPEAGFGISRFITGPVGDINADGIDDIALFSVDENSSSTLKTHILFGNTELSDIDLSTNNDGFIIEHDIWDAWFFKAVSGAGDVNGDGFDDLLISDPDAADGSGILYIVYGKNDTETMYLSDIATGNGGFSTTGNATDELGIYLASGDFTGDGISDMLIGAPYSDANNLNDAGRVYLLPGSGNDITLWGTSAAETLTGTEAADTIAAGQGNDTLISNGGADVLYAGPGDDTIVINDTNFIRIDGGTGTDTLQFNGAGLNLNLADAAAWVRSIEIIDLTGNGDNTISFHKSLSDSTRIIVKGDTGDKLFSASQQWVSAGDTTILDGIEYAVYTSGYTELLVQTGVETDINNAPTINAQSFSVDEHTTGGTVIGTIEADANDIGDSLTFSVLSGNEAGQFSLDSNTGQLRVANSIARLDYEDGASYTLTVQVTDSFEETASAIITINVNNLDTRTTSLSNLAITASEQSIWGNDGIPQLALIEELANISYSDDLSNYPIDLSAVSLDMAGTLNIATEVELNGGTVDANLPIDYTLSYPDEIEVGQPVSLNTSVALGNGAEFTVSIPNFNATASATITNYQLNFSTDIPNAVNQFIGDKSFSTSGGLLSESVSISSEESSVTSSLSNDNALRLEASVDLPEWVNETVSYAKTWNGINMYNTYEGCREDVLSSKSVNPRDLYYKFHYTIYDSALEASVGLTQQYSLELTPTGTLTLEDGSEYVFNLSEGLTFTPQSTMDTNDDGIITATLQIELTPFFNNSTTVTSTLSNPLKLAKAQARIQDAVCSPGQVTFDDVYPIVSINENMGYLVDVEPSLSSDDNFDPISFNLPGQIYTEELVFDLCDSGSQCAAPAVVNNAPTAAAVSVSGDSTVDSGLTATYTYTDIDGDPESGSVYQWQQTSDATGSNSTDINGANATQYTLTSAEVDNYIRFCVTPNDGQDTGTQQCSDWLGPINSNDPPETATTPMAGFAGALAFADGAYVELPFIFDPATQSAFTVELWFYTELPATAQSLFSQRYGTGIGRNWLYIGSANGNTLATLLGDTWINSISAGTLSTHTWHHGALVYDNGNMSLYLNGELVSTSPVTPEASDGTLVLNRDGSFSGMMDEVRIWNIARSQQDIQQHMNLGLTGAETGLLAYYTFDEGEGDTLTDHTNHGYDGSLQNNPVWTISRQAYFDGIDDYVDTEANFTELAKASFTLEAWIKTSVNNAAQAILVSNNGDTTWEKGEKAFYLDQAGRPNFVGYGNDYLRGTTAVNDGQWHHLAVTWDFTGSTGNIYVNGNLDTDSGNSGYTANHANNAGDTFKIGFPNYGEVPNYFDGEISTLRVWNQALTESELQTYMTQAPANTANGLVAFYNLENDGGSITNQAEEVLNLNTAMFYDTSIVSDGTAPSPDWDVGFYKGQCTTDEAMTGLSVTVADTQAHRLACVNGIIINNPTGVEARIIGGNGDIMESRQINGNLDADWDVNYYKWECGLNEFISGISQSTDSREIHQIRCSYGIDTSTCSTREVGNGDSMASQTFGDWDVGYYKTQCADNEVVAGLSVSPSEGTVHKLLCCSRPESSDTVSIHGNPNWFEIPVATLTNNGSVSGQLPATGGLLNFNLINDASLGNVTLNTDGSFSYTPTDASESGSDSFEYQVSNDLGEDSRTVSLTLTGLSINGSTGGSSTVNSKDLLAQLAQGQIEGNCLPQSYPELDQDRLTVYSTLAGVPLAQNPQHGGLEVVRDGNRFAFGITALNPNGGDNKRLHLLPESQSILFQTDGETLLTQPVIQAPCALQQALNEVALGDFKWHKNGLITIFVEDGAWFYAKPDWQAHPLNQLTHPGLSLDSTQTPPTVYLEFQDETGLWRQALYPVIAQPEVLETINLAMENGEVHREVNGILTITLDNQRYQAIPDYLVIQGNNQEGILKLENLSNSQGFVLVYPDGKRQAFYWLP